MNGERVARMCEYMRIPLPLGPFALLRMFSLGVRKQDRLPHRGHGLIRLPAQQDIKAMSIYKYKYKILLPENLSHEERIDRQSDESYELSIISIKSLFNSKSDDGFYYNCKRDGVTLLIESNSPSDLFDKKIKMEAEYYDLVAKKINI